jgi:aryl-alcohol dehydrogenase-like predicted oxidoreductase
MELRPLGSTGLAVSPIGLGMAALGRPGYLNLGHGADLEGLRNPDALRTHATAVLDEAYVAGVRYFDVARSYGRGEEFLAGWLAGGVPVPGEVVVGSKWGYHYTAGWEVEAEVHEVKDHSPAMLDRQAAESRAILGRHLDIYQIHSATQATGVLDDREVISALATMREQGIAVGLTTSGVGQAATIRRAIDVRVDGALLFSTVQSTWNLFEPSAGPALLEASQAGLAVIVKEAVANGRLTARNPDLPAALRDLRHAPDAVAIAAALHQPWATVVLSGATTVAQLHSNLAALQVTSAEVGELRPLAEDADAYWALRGDLRWT